MLLAALMMTAMPVPLPEPTQDVKDARCVFSMLAFSEKASDTDKASLNGVMLFFVGKLAGRHTPEEIRNILNAVEKEADTLDLKAIAQACSQEMVKTGSVLQGL